MPWDVVWYSLEREPDALLVVRRLPRLEVLARRIEGMRGLRVCLNAPMPDESGRVSGRGVCVFRNVLGTQDLAPGAVVHDDRGATPAILALCGPVHRLAPGLMAADFLPDALNSDVFLASAKQQADNEARSRAILERRQRTVWERIALDLARLLRLIVFLPVQWALLALGFVALTVIECPARVICAIFEAARFRRRQAILEQPFSPAAEASAAIAALKGGMRR